MYILVSKIDLTWRFGGIEPPKFKLEAFILSINLNLLNLMSLGIIRGLIQLVKLIEMQIF